MRKLLLSLAVPVVAIALVVTAFAVVPSALNTLAPGSSDAATSVPAWTVGTTWTYNLSFASWGEDAVIPEAMLASTWGNGTWGNASRVFGTLTETVVGTVSTADGAAYNVTETLALRLGYAEPTAEPAFGLPTYERPLGNVTGFVWVRESDLAPVYAYKAVHLVRTWNVTAPTSPWTGDGGWGFANGTYTSTYDAGTAVSFDPGLTVVPFPLTENATVNVTSNATVRTWSSFALTGPNVTYGWNHFMNVTIPLAFVVRTGTFENVTTPAGTFSSLPVAVYRKPFVHPAWDNDTDALTNLTLNVDCLTSRALVRGAFSEAVGNFVQATFGFGGFEGSGIELILAAYHAG